MEAVPFRRVEMGDIRENKGNFTLVRGTAFRVIELKNYSPETIDSDQKALPLVVINENEEFKLGDYLYHMVEANDPIYVYEVGEDIPLTSYTAFPAYIENSIVCYEKSNSYQSQTDP